MHTSLHTAVRRSACALLLLLVFISLAAATALAQEASTPASSRPPPSASPAPSPTLERRFFKNILRDQRAIWTSPLRLRAKDATWLAPLAISTAVLIATDRETAGELTNNEERLEVSRSISYGGALYTTGTMAAAVYLIGRQQHNPRARETGLLGAQALIDGLIVTKALKVIARRPRPLEDAGRGRFFDGGGSFPSGHAISAWSFATIVAEEYRHRPLIRWGAYSLATAVSISRFTARKHFLSDVLVGSAIGYGIGRYVYNAHHDPSLDSDKGAKTSGAAMSRLFPSIAPHYNRRGHIYGLNLTWSF
ncbi:MAG TPA: phosphatase PAP2 family protein [Pyrinomonadaceae bacterium]|jgi:membrane-associated phospholipid phosphatase